MRKIGKKSHLALGSALAILAGVCCNFHAVAQSIILDNTANTFNQTASTFYDPSFGSVSFAQAFTTGNNDYTLNSISPIFISGNQNGFQLSLYTDNSGNVGSQFAVLSGPDSPSSGSTAYSPSTTLFLQPATTYWFVGSVAQVGTPNFQVSETADTGFVTTDGWSVGDSCTYAVSGWFNPGNSEVLQFSINATIIPVPEPSTLALTAVGCSVASVLFGLRRFRKA